MFLDHTQRRSTVVRTPLDEWSARRRDLYLTTHDTHNRPQAAHLLRSWVRIPPGALIFVCCECRVLSGRGLCDELITRPEESYRLCCVVVCDLEASRIGAPYMYDISSLRVKTKGVIVTLFTSHCPLNINCVCNCVIKGISGNISYSHMKTQNRKNGIFLPIFFVIFLSVSNVFQTFIYLI